jgi:putative addiction module CopG family antidote
MTITIPLEFQGFIEHAVASGRYRSEAEVFADALRLLRDHDRQWDPLHDDIETGLNELDRGGKTVVDVEDIKRRGRDRLNKQSTRS